MTFQERDGKWWYVLNGYTVGPFDTEELAVDKYNEAKDKLSCPTGGCDE